MNYVKPNVYSSWSGTKVFLWNWLEEEIGKNEDSFELDQSRLAEEFGVSRTAVINAIKTFISANLLRKVSSGRGRGNHSEYELLWDCQEKEGENVTPSRVNKKPQEKNTTKGSKTFRYYAYKFRTLVENSNLSGKASVVVGTILDYLAGKPGEIFNQWLIYLRSWLEEKRTLKDFFVYFHRTLKQLVKGKQKIERTRQFIENQREQRKKARKQYEKDPPPRSGDYARFSDYLDAMEAWEG